MPKTKVCEECGADFMPEHTDSKICNTCKEIDSKLNTKGLELCCTWCK